MLISNKLVSAQLQACESVNRLLIRTVLVTIIATITVTKGQNKNKIFSILLNGQIETRTSIQKTQTLLF